jgi:hypothetical protein
MTPEDASRLRNFLEHAATDLAAACALFRPPNWTAFAASQGFTAVEHGDVFTYRYHRVIDGGPLGNQRTLTP